MEMEKGIVNSKCRNGSNSKRIWIELSQSFKVCFFVVNGDDDDDGDDGN